MRWVRGSLLVDGRLVEGALAIRGGVIDRVVLGEAADREARRGDPDVVEASIVAPGFLDLQVNGGFGADVGREGAAAVETLCRHLPATGVTAFLPTIISSPADVYRTAAAMAPVLGRARPGEAIALGLHLEGPLLSPARAGAHPRAAIESAASAAPAIDALVEAGLVRLVTLAPERPGAIARCRELVGRGVAVSLGHTDATFEQMVGGIDAGAVLVTHLFNAMSPLHHRSPGAVGAALTDRRVTVGLIADGVHCHAAALRLALAARGAAGIALVTDAIAAMGMPPGTYALGPVEVRVADGACRLADGTLAGSIATLDHAVRVMVAASATPAEALTMASTVPARVLGLSDRGELAPGRIADLVLLDEALRVEATWIGGREVFGGAGRSP
jgi:N-acetylglucosamine-6-phosphate deacetylase